FELPQDIIEALQNSLKNETNPLAIKILNLILENAKIAREQKLPLCQDCGNVYINLNIGRDVYVEVCSDHDGNSKNEKTGLEVGFGASEVDLIKAINSTVARVYNENYLRKSIVSDPLFERKNTKGNIPAIVDFSFCSNPGIEVEVLLKGGGSENCSYLFMLNPSATREKVVEIVTRTVKENVSRCCPPVIVGVGIGSTASKVMELSRKAAFRNLNIRNSDPRYRELEEEILEKVNSTGIGPQGLGGKTTALACNIEFSPCHMATLPLAISLGCHSTRRASSKI
ncbi:MAG: fumarate hydratase, partial [Actinobacteria bacterium]|nr:fumarate hydratase [Actinomycetota bacterium]